jgi:hypothetical protein
MAVLTGAGRARRHAVGVALGLLLGANAVRAAEAALEYDVKAAFLLNFAKFVQWPASKFPDAQTPLRLCLLRQNPFGDTLDRMVQRERIGGRAVEVRRIASPDFTDGCHILFVPQVVMVEDGAAAVPVEAALLTVGESDDFLRRGGIISFFAESGRIRFAINSDAAERSCLRMSSRLLRVARLTPANGAF